MSRPGAARCIFLEAQIGVTRRSTMWLCGRAAPAPRVQHARAYGARTAAPSYLPRTSLREGLTRWGLRSLSPQTLSTGKHAEKRAVHARWRARPCVARCSTLARSVRLLRAPRNSHDRRGARRRVHRRAALRLCRHAARSATATMPRCRRQRRRCTRVPTRSSVRPQISCKGRAHFLGFLAFGFSPPRTAARGASTAGIPLGRSSRSLPVPVCALSVFALRARSRLALTRAPRPLQGSRLEPRTPSFAPLSAQPCFAGILTDTAARRGRRRRRGAY